ncbi:MAG TPA: DegT/DnrJ/EryC1/StrS family aminotransferase, partial [Cytophagales bacterium]
VNRPESSVMINVTKTYLPPLEEYHQYLQGIWERVHVTNHGPLVLELEAKLKAYLGVKHLFFVNNGTIALQIAVKALGLAGEVITTPFSYVATTSSLVWEGCRPVFVDIDPETLTLDAARIEEAITDQTTGILATHVYGNPCDVDAIGQVAGRHGLKVIYDAAHAFGVHYRGKSLLDYGDVATLSFHATKLFHTGEGGAIVTNDDALAHRIAYMRNFGHNGPEAFWGVGINGKSSELHAAMGLCVLPRVAGLIESRRQLFATYDALLAKADLQRPVLRPATEYNYAYYPVLFPTEEKLLEARDALNREDIFPRRYFYPALNTLDYAGGQSLPVAEDVARRVLCLPLYHDLERADAARIAGIIVNVFAHDYCRS